VAICLGELCPSWWTNASELSSVDSREDLCRSFVGPGTDHSLFSFRVSFDVLLLLPPPLSKVLCPSDQAAEGPCDGDVNQTSSADLVDAAAAPPLALLPEPHRAQVTEVSQRSPRGGGGVPAISPDVASHSRLAIRGRCR